VASLAGRCSSDLDILSCTHQFVNDFFHFFSTFFEFFLPAVFIINI
jgi:hypothetical protein